MLVMKRVMTAKKLFSLFFISLYQFLIACRNSDNNALKDLGTRALFQGTVYRYLGYGSAIGDINKPKEIKYNNIYVSWSKNKRNEYIESKLYGVITLMTCEISDDYYGIDLEELGVSRGYEREVVFPNYENLVTKIKSFKN